MDPIDPDVVADPEPDPSCFTITIELLKPEADAEPVAVPLWTVDMVIVLDNPEAEAAPAPEPNCLEITRLFDAPEAVAVPVAEAV
jgi:hypothetical protein